MKSVASITRCMNCGEICEGHICESCDKLNKIKIIDLLNMIANGEKVPKKIQWGVHEFTWQITEYLALDELGKPTLIEVMGCTKYSLNDEIEIIEYSEETEDLPTISEEQELFNKLNSKDQEYILHFMRMLQPCEEMSDNNE